MWLVILAILDYSHYNGSTEHFEKGVPVICDCNALPVEVKYHVAIYSVIFIGTES